VKPVKKAFSILAVLILAVSVLAACGTANNEGQTDQPGQNNEQGGNNQGTAGGENLSGEITVAGSSTVYPITILAAEQFMEQYPEVSISVASTGTGGGFKKWVKGETDINNASRPIKEEEKAEAAKLGIEPIELAVAYDGITVVVNKENDFVDYLTVDELKKIWDPAAEGKITKWSQVREGWPDEKIKLYGPGTDSGTFEYFTEAIVGEAKKSRTDYQPSEDDNVLVQGVAGDKYALGYFGYAYYLENQDQLKVVPIKAGEGDPVAPSDETIKNGTYKPLSRPVFIYVSNKAMERPEVKAFVQFYMDNAAQFVHEAGYTPLPDEKYAEEKAKIK